MENKAPDPPKNKPQRPNDPDRRPSAFAQYSSIGLQMLGTIGLGVWAGQWLDASQQNKLPIWTIVLSMTAIGASLYLFIRQLPRQD
ncbi:MAG: AtpZ/AtpI family protein [Bacteroidetes bacterium]|nr:AtpZ/AtpI family protein [Fibrella sp.]